MNIYILYKRSFKKVLVRSRPWKQSSSCMCWCLWTIMFRVTLFVVANGIWAALCSICICTSWIALDLAWLTNLDFWLAVWHLQILKLDGVETGPSGVTFTYKQCVHLYNFLGTRFHHQTIHSLQGKKRANHSLLLLKCHCSNCVTASRKRSGPMTSV